MLVPVGRHGEVGGLPRAESEHQIPVATGPAAGEFPHGAAQRVAPPAQQHVPVHVGLIVRLVKAKARAAAGSGRPTMCTLPPARVGPRAIISVAYLSV
jgi:hypothetical protein